MIRFAFQGDVLGYKKFGNALPWELPLTRQGLTLDSRHTATAQLLCPVRNPETGGAVSIKHPLLPSPPQPGFSWCSLLNLFRIYMPLDSLC